MRRPRSGKIASRIARASAALIGGHHSTHGWLHDATGAMRQLLRARQTVLFVDTGAEQHVAGDEGATTLVRQLAARWQEHGGNVPLARIGRAATAALPGASLGELVPPDRAAAASSVGERFDVVWLLCPLPDGEGMIGACCAFGPMSERVARSRLSLLQAVWPVLEAAVRVRLAPRAGARSLGRLVHALTLGAALLSRDGAILETNHALDRLLANGEDGAALREEFARAAAALCSPRSRDRARGARGQGQHRRVHVREVPSTYSPGGPSLIALVDAALHDVPPAADSASLLHAHFQLTAREREVAQLLQLGRSNAAIALALGISPNTARHYTERVLSKLGIQSRAAIHGVLFAARQEVTPTPSRGSGDPWLWRDGTDQPVSLAAHAAS